MPVQMTSKLPGKSKVLAAIKKEETACLKDVGSYIRAKAAKYPTQNPNTTYRRTGTLGRSIAVSEVQSSGQGLFVEVGTNKHYAPYVEYGTGIYGPKGREIVPKTAKALAWRALAARMYGVKGGKIGPGFGNATLIALGTSLRKGKVRRNAKRDVYMIFAKSVKGMQPWHYMEKAFKAPDSLAYFKQRAEQMYAQIKVALATGG